MDRLVPAGGAVVEELSESCEFAKERAEFLRTSVKGEYEDEDGDWATAFIVAEPKPCGKLLSSNGSQGSEPEHAVLSSKMKAPLRIGTNGSSNGNSVEPMWSNSDLNVEKGSISVSGYPLRNPTREASNSRESRDISYEYIMEDDCMDSCEDTESKVAMNESTDKTAEFKALVRRVMGGNRVRHHSAVVGCGESFSRKRRLDVSNLSYQSDDKLEDGVFYCKLCGETLLLNELCTSLTCSCLVCNSCCGFHVEKYLTQSIGRGGATDMFGSGEVSKNREDKSANFTSILIANDSEERACNGDQGADNDVCQKSGLHQGTETNVQKLVVKEEDGLDLYVDLFPEESDSSLGSISCPIIPCNGRLHLSGAQVLAPEAFKKWEEVVSEELMEHSTSYIKCPGCQVVIEKVTNELPPGMALSGVPEFDRTVPFIELDSDGKQLSRLALCHREANRFRCSMCSVDFCGQCMNVPYHLGKTCEELEEEKNSVKCLYCEVSVRYGGQQENLLSPTSVRELRKELEKEDVDALWCVEKIELVSVQKFASSVCSGKECRQRLRTACTRNLECGHHCGGVRGERFCLPCLEDDCREKVAFHSGGRYIPSADDDCSICLVEPLRRAPSILLSCGHVVHMHCARRKLEEGCPGPEISFGYLNCPQCPELMQHHSLTRYMQRSLALLEKVREKALRRLKMEGLFKSAKDLKVGERFEGRPSEFALQLYHYYVCCKCGIPYFGGRRDCAENNREQREIAFNPSELVCGGCSAAAGGQGLCRKGHGKEFVEFKCRFCCSPATYFCFGHTHFCERCHVSRPDANPNFVPVQCKGPSWCRLQTAHAPNGQESCLGCSMCRLRGQ